MQLLSTSSSTSETLLSTSETLLSRSETFDTEILYQSTAHEIRRKLKWALLYVMYATILWLIIIASFVYLPTNSREIQESSKWEEIPIWQYVGVCISIFNILLLWIYLAIYRSITVGILFFVHNIVNAEVAYYCMIRRYACFDSDTLCEFGLYSMLFHEILQWTFSCASSCFNKCRIGQRLNLYWGKLTVLVTFICIIWVTGVYVAYAYISVGVLINNRYQENAAGIIIVAICVFLTTFGIFPFPFCKDVTIQVIESWNCPCCYGKSMQHEVLKPYAETYGIEEERRANYQINEML